MSRWLLALSAMLWGAGCAVPVNTACDGVVCTAGVCVSSEGQVACVCTPEELAAGASCQLARDPLLAPNVPEAVLQLNVPHSGEFSLHPEAHRYRLELDAGFYSLRCESTLGACGLELWSLGQRVATTAPVQGGSELSWSVGDRGTYEIIAWKSVSSDGYPYSMLATQLADAEGSGYGSALQVAAPFILDGTFALPGDVDYFRVTTQVAGWYQFSFDPEVGGSFLRQPTLFVSNGGPTSAAQPWLPPGEHLLVASGTGPYRLRAELLATDDHGNDPAGATWIEVGASAQGAFEFRLDVDVFAFQAVAGRTYRLECVPQGELHPCRTLPGIRAPTDGVQTLAVQGTDASAGDRYRVTLLEGEDDHGNSMPTATLVTPGPVRMEFQYVGDEDYLAVDLAAREILLSGGFEIVAPPVGTFDLYSRTNFVSTKAAQRVYLRRGDPFAMDGCVVCERTLTLRGPDLAGSNFSEGLAVEFPFDVSGELEVLFDRDVYTFDVATSGNYILTCEAAGEGEGGVGCGVISPSGTQVGNPTGAAGTTSMTLAAGSYGVRVFSTSDLQWGPLSANRQYRVQIQRL